MSDVDGFWGPLVAPDGILRLSVSAPGAKVIDSLRPRALAQRPHTPHLIAIALLLCVRGASAGLWVDAWDRPNPDIDGLCSQLGECARDGYSYVPLTCES